LSKHQKTRPDNRRASLANEAARIIQEQGLKDFRSAKDKAVERLGYRNAGALPSNGEIETALAERNRIFRGDLHLAHLEQLRQTALKMMTALSTYHPRLVGPVLSGHVTEHSNIELHLFNDSVETVSGSLDALRISHRIADFRHRFRQGQSEKFPGYRFHNEGCDFQATVFPELRRRHAPLSPVDGKPMQRADGREIERLLNPAAS
jgi:hypothetical protein